MSYLPKMLVVTILVLGTCSVLIAQKSESANPPASKTALAELLEKTGSTVVYKMDLLGSYSDPGVPKGLVLTTRLFTIEAVELSTKLKKRGVALCWTFIEPKEVIDWKECRLIDGAEVPLLVRALQDFRTASESGFKATYTIKGDTVFQEDRTGFWIQGFKYPNSSKLVALLAKFTP